MTTCNVRGRGALTLATLSLAILLISPQANAVIIAGAADNFDVPHNYLAAGVAGTIWDGVYTGGGSFPGGNGGAVAGSTLTANANISNAGRLTVASANTAWDGAEDDGFFLFRNMPG